MGLLGTRRKIILLTDNDYPLSALLHIVLVLVFIIIVIPIIDLISIPLLDSYFPSDSSARPILWVMEELILRRKVLLS